MDKRFFSSLMKDNQMVLKQMMKESKQTEKEEKKIRI